MFRFPSIRTAILAGAVSMPLFIWGVDYIQKNLGSQLLLFLWSLICFFLPVVVSTGDLRYIRNRIRAEGTLSGKLRAVRATREDLKLFFVPAWTRMAVLFLSAIISILLLKFMGIDL